MTPHVDPCQNHLPWDPHESRLTRDPPPSSPRTRIGIWMLFLWRAHLAECHRRPIAGHSQDSHLQSTREARPGYLVGLSSISRGTCIAYLQLPAGEPMGVVTHLAGSLWAFFQKAHPRLTQQHRYRSRLVGGVGSILVSDVSGVFWFGHRCKNLVRWS